MQYLLNKSNLVIEQISIDVYPKKYRLRSGMSTFSVLCYPLHFVDVDKTEHNYQRASEVYKTEYLFFNFKDSNIPQFKDHYCLIEQEPQHCFQKILLQNQQKIGLDRLVPFVLSLAECLQKLMDSKIHFILDHSNVVIYRSKLYIRIEPLSVKLAYDQNHIRSFVDMMYEMLKQSTMVNMKINKYSLFYVIKDQRCLSRELVGYYDIMLNALKAKCNVKIQTIIQQLRQLNLLSQDQQLNNLNNRLRKYRNKHKYELYKTRADIYQTNKWIEYVFANYFELACLDKNSESAYTTICHFYINYSEEVRELLRREFLILDLNSSKFKEKAYHIFLQAVHNHKGNSDLYLYLANYQKKINKNLPQAYRYLAQAIEICPNAQIFYHERALSLETEDKFEQALRDYDKAVSLNPQQPRLHYNRGELLKVIKRLDQALIATLRSRQLDYFNVNVHNQIAKILFEMKKYTESQESINVALEIDPDNAYTYYVKALLQKQKKKPLQALASLNFSISQNSNNDRTYQERALIYTQLGRYQLAEADYTQILQRFKKTGCYFYQARAKVRIEMCKFEGALQDINKAFQKGDYAKNFMFRSIIYYSTNELEKALKDCTVVIQRQYNLKETYDLRANIHTALQSYQLAIIDLNNALLQCKKPESDYMMSLYHKRGTLYHFINKYQQALEDYSKCIQLRPKWQEAYVNRAAIYVEIGCYLAAMEDYDQAVKLAEVNHVHLYQKILLCKKLNLYPQVKIDYAHLKKLT